MVYDVLDQVCLISNVFDYIDFPKIFIIPRQGDSWNSPDEYRCVSLQNVSTSAASIAIHNSHVCKHSCICYNI